MPDDAASSAGRGTPEKVGDASAEGATLSGNYSLSPNAQVAAFAGRATVTAVEATDRRNNAEPLVALVCSGDVVPRIEAMEALRGLDKSGALPLRDFGPVDWADHRQRMAAIYPAAKGGRFALSGPLPAWQIIDAFWKSVLPALTEIHGRAVIHRAIRPDNLFIRDPGVPALVLGPCVAVPPGYDQPDIYEPLETASADLTGRGEGTPRHDMFALGMTAVAMLLGREPGAGVDKDDLMIRRIEMGSLAAVIDPENVPPEIADPLRGLLMDAPGERWTLKDLGLWLQGARISLPHLHPRSLAAKPLTIAGKQVRCARSLAHMIGRAWSEGAKLLRGEELRRWLRQEASDHAAAALVDHALQEPDPEGGGFDNDVLLAARAVIALDPQGPVRYCGLAVDPYGLGPFLFDAAKNREKMEVAVSLVDQGLLQKLIDRRPDRRRATRQAINFERLRRWITSPQAWEGIDRCIYDLNPRLPCLSPMTGGKWIAGGSALVAAFDQQTQRGANPELKIDASAAAFLGARIDADGYTLMALMSPDTVEEDVLLDAIRLFADEQRDLDLRPLPGIARWCGKLGQRIAESIHHRPTRKELLSRIEAAVPEGNIAALYKALAIDGLKDADKRGFDDAKSGWEKIESEIWAIEREAERIRLHAWRRGRDNVPVASGAGSILAFLVTLFLDSIR
jgi:eukaryotic-like serine/threonine-protein kinase